MIECCADCKHANYYAAYYWYPFLDPYCSITKLSIKPEDGCGEFELIGRHSR